MSDIPEQDARELLERMGIDAAESWSSGEVVDLANLFADRDALAAENVKLREDAELGRILMRYIDRLTDADDECDPLGKIAKELGAAVDEAITRFRAQRALAAPKP